MSGGSAGSWDQYRPRPWRLEALVLALRKNLRKVSKISVIGEYETKSLEVSRGMSCQLFHCQTSNSASQRNRCYQVQSLKMHFIVTWANSVTNNKVCHACLALWSFLNQINQIWSINVNMPINAYICLYVYYVNISGLQRLVNRLLIPAVTHKCEMRSAQVDAQLSEHVKNEQVKMNMWAWTSICAQAHTFILGFEWVFWQSTFFESCKYVNM